MVHSTIITYNDIAEQVFDDTKILEATGFKLINVPPYASDSPTVITGAFYQIRLRLCRMIFVANKANLR